jgi:hypothetical protein
MNLSYPRLVAGIHLLWQLNCLQLSELGIVFWPVSINQAIQLNRDSAHSLYPGTIDAPSGLMK